MSFEITFHCLVEESSANQVAYMWTGPSPWPSIPARGGHWVCCQKYTFPAVEILDVLFHGPGGDNSNCATIDARISAEMAQHLVDEHGFFDV